MYHVITTSNSLLHSQRLAWAGMLCLVKKRNPQFRWGQTNLHTLVTLLLVSVSGSCGRTRITCFSLYYFYFHVRHVLQSSRYFQRSGSNPGYACRVSIVNARLSTYPSVNTRVGGVELKHTPFPRELSCMHSSVSVRIKNSGDRMSFCNTPLLMVNSSILIVLLSGSGTVVNAEAEAYTVRTIAHSLLDAFAFSRVSFRNL